MLTYDYIEKLIAQVRIAYPFNYKNFTGKDFEILIEMWHEDLSGYPEAIVSEAFKRARTSNKISVTTADIIEQIEKIQAAHGESEQDLWQEFVTILNSADGLGSKLKFTMLEANGKTQGENAIGELQALYESMRAEFKRYCGSASGLLQLARLDDEALSFERARFLKDIRKKQAEIKLMQESPALTDVLEKTKLLD